MFLKLFNYSSRCLYLFSTANPNNTSSCTIANEKLNLRSSSTVLIKSSGVIILCQDKLL